MNQNQNTLTALALVAAGEGVAILPTLALTGVAQDGVDILENQRPSVVAREAPDFRAVEETTRRRRRVLVSVTS